MRLSPWSNLSKEEEKRQYELSSSLGIRDAVHQKRLFYEEYIRSSSSMTSSTTSSTRSTTNVMTEPLHNMERSRIEQIKNKLRYLERWLFSIVSGPQYGPTIEVDCKPISRSLWSMPLREESKEEESKENNLNDEAFPYKLHQIEDINAIIRLPPSSTSSIEDKKRQYDLSPSWGTRDAVHQKRLFYEKHIRSSSSMTSSTTSSTRSTTNVMTEPMHNMGHNRIEKIKNKLRYLERRLFSVVSGPQYGPTIEVDCKPVLRRLWSMPLREESKEEESKENDLNNELFQHTLHHREDINVAIRLSPSSQLSSLSTTEEVEGQNEVSQSLGIRGTVHQKRSFYEKYIRSSSPHTTSSTRSTTSVLAEPLHNMGHSRIKQIKNKLRYLERWPFSVVSGSEDIPFVKAKRGATSISVEMNEHLIYYYTTLAQ